MRYAKISLLYFENVFEHRLRSLVWFLLPLFNSLILILFWRGATGSGSIEGWDFKAFFTYYLLLTIISSLLMSHVEEDVALRDIKQGELVKYLTKPFSYYFFKLFSEIPNRVLQGIYGVIILSLAFAFYGQYFSINPNPQFLIFNIVIFTFAYLIAFTLKMLLAFLAFWMIDIHGIFQLHEVIVLIAGGFILPVPLMPSFLKTIAEILPFSYIIYYPVTLIMGKFTLFETLNIILIQIAWLLILLGLYKYTWSKGIRKFTGVGS